jgi:hypothetical protein
MARTPSPPHGDTIVAALPHFNDRFRRPYGLPALTDPFLRTLGSDEDLFRDANAVRRSGVLDASCAIIARIALQLVPRYAAGLAHGERQVAVVDPDVRDDAPFLSGPVLLINPLGGLDNWRSLAKWFRSVEENRRRESLAGLASEIRRDYAVIDPLLRNGPDGRAAVIPPSEAFSASRAAEVSFIYDIPVETLRAWKRRYRPERAARKPGAPRTNR